MEFGENQVNQSCPNQESASILELKGELGGLVAEDQHPQQSTKPTSQRANENQVKLADSTLIRLPCPQFIITKQDERNKARQGKPAKEQLVNRAHLDI